MNKTYQMEYYDLEVSHGESSSPLIWRLKLAKLFH